LISNLVRGLSFQRLESLNPSPNFPPVCFSNLTRMPGSSVSAVETLTMRELRERLLGFDKDEYTGRWVLRIRGIGEVLVNGNVVRRFKDIDGVLHAPDNWIASIRTNGEAWLFRVASPAYVEVPAEDVVNTVKSVLPGVTKFGRWEGERIMVEEGAVYGEITGMLGRSSHPQVGDFLYIIRITWGNDGYTAFRIFKTIGVLKCTNGLIVGFDAFKRIFHSRLNGPLPDKVRDVLGRIKNVITSISINSNALDSLSGTVNAETIEKLAKRFPDFTKLYNEYKSQYGDTMMAVFQALGYIATHGSQRNSERAISAMSRLVSLN